MTGHKRRIMSIFFVVLLFVPIIAVAHVPYIERIDYSEDQPFYVWKMIEKSKAFYAWLETNDQKPSTDIDVYEFTVRNNPVNIYVELIVPVVGDYYQNFAPWFALVGPDLPASEHEIPFDIPEGYGVVIKENVEPGENRSQFYEPFGGKSYYNGPILDLNISKAGSYYIYCWNPYQQGGDYVMVIGKGEFFGPIDIVRSLINTFIIRQNGELHIR